MTDALPLLVYASDAFASRLPSQRVLDLLAKEEPAGFAQVAQTQPFRIVAFRALLRDFPDYDPTALWLHAYDVEVEVAIGKPYQRDIADQRARFCRYWRMTPAEVDELADGDFAAMVRLMIREAKEIKAAQNKRR